jgi:hypothetical protein
MGTEAAIVIINLDKPGLINQLSLLGDKKFFGRAKKVITSPTFETDNEAEEKIKLVTKPLTGIIQTISVPGYSVSLILSDFKQ